MKIWICEKENIGFKSEAEAIRHTISTDHSVKLHRFWKNVPGNIKIIEDSNKNDLKNQNVAIVSDKAKNVDIIPVDPKQRKRKFLKLAGLGIGISIVSMTALNKTLNLPKSGSDASPAINAAITSQGIILPGLVQDPSNPYAGQVWYRSDLGLVKWYDGINNTNNITTAWNNFRGKPYIMVSSKGKSNNLSDITNDGADFGPDTPYGYGSGLTQTSGIQEALDYLGSNGGGVIKLNAGTYYASDIIYLQYGNTKIVGENMGSTVIHIAYPFHALGSGGFQNINAIVTTDPSGSANPEYTGIENVTVDASEAGNAKAGITIIMFRWGSHLTFKNIKMTGLNGTSPNPNGLNGGVDFVDIENYIAKSSDYVASGSTCGTLVLTGGSNIHVSNVYMDGLWEFDGTVTPNSTFENIEIHGNDILLDGSSKQSWGYTAFRNVNVFNGLNWALNGFLQTNEGCYFINCYFEGVVRAAARHTYNCEFNGGLGSVNDFRNNRVYMIDKALFPQGVGLPMGIGAYEDSDGMYVAYVTGNIFINLTANSVQGGSAFNIGGFNAGTDTDNLLIISDNIFPTGFSGLFGYNIQAATLILIVENNTGPFKTNMQNTQGTPATITALPGSVIKNNSCLLPGYPFSTTTAVIQVNPPVSGTAYQNTNPFDIEMNIPVYASTSGTSGYVTIYKGLSSTSLLTIGNQYVDGNTNSSNPQLITLMVKSGWYYKITASNVTIGTAVIIGE